jgi:hypothetical protein
VDISMTEKLIKDTPEKRLDACETASTIPYVRMDSPSVMTIDGEKNRNVWIVRPNDIRLSGVNLKSRRATVSRMLLFVHTDERQARAVHRTI